MSIVFCKQSMLRALEGTVLGDAPGGLIAGRALHHAQQRRASRRCLQRRQPRCQVPEVLCAPTPTRYDQVHRIIVWWCSVSKQRGAWLHSRSSICAAQAENTEVD